MYLPSVIPSDIRTDWMYTSSDNSNQLTSNIMDDGTNRRNTNTNNNTNSRSRKSDFPPLSFYTPNRSTPLFMNNVNKKTFSTLKNSQNFKKLNSRFDDHKFESIEQLSLELGTRIHKLKAFETWGYSFIKPLGLNKTMNQLIEESNDLANELVNNDEDELYPDNNNDDITGNEDQNSNGEMDVVENADDNRRSRDLQEHTHLMTENLGQMQRNDNSLHENNISTETPNENANENRNIDYILEDSVENENEHFERDLDAELSDHDLSGSSVFQDHDDTFYGDEEYEHRRIDHRHKNTQEEEEEEEGEEVVEEENDDDDDYDIGNDAVVEDDFADTEEMEIEQTDNNNNNNNIISQARIDPILHSSFNDDIVEYSLPINSKPKANHSIEEVYFMAYEDYQDDHSIVEGINTHSRPYESRNVSIAESTFTRRSNNSDRRYLDSGNLTTPSTITSNIPNPSTGNTTADDVIRGSDFDLTLD